MNRRAWFGIVSYYIVRDVWYKATDNFSSRRFSFEYFPYMCNILKQQRNPFHTVKSNTSEGHMFRLTLLRWCRSEREIPPNTKTGLLGIDVVMTFLIDDCRWWIFGMSWGTSSKTNLTSPRVCFWGKESRSHHVPTRSFKRQWLVSLLFDFEQKASAVRRRDHSTHRRIV